MGLPGSGKTYLAGALKKYLEQNSTVKNMPMYRAGEYIPTN
jgi:tRNA uridine 5-carbamoylmethylation protein Kti12